MLTETTCSFLPSVETQRFIFETGGSRSEDGLQRRVCALLSLPWVSENRSSSAYKGSGFPTWLPALAQRLDSCYCEDLPPPLRAVLGDTL